MKKNLCFLPTGVIIYLMVVVGFVSCQEKEIARNQKSQSLTLEQIFSKAAETDATKDQVVEVSMEWTSKSQTGIIKKINVRELTVGDWGPYLENDNISAGVSGGGYTVSCSVNCKGCSGTADGPRGAAKIAKACLDNNGCATVCKASVIYYPEDKHFDIIPLNEEDEK